MRTFLVTGGAGFIGSNTCDRLIKEGHIVYNVDNFNEYYDPSIKRNNIKQHNNQERYHLCEGDIRDFDFLEKIFKDNNIDVIIHLAARAGVRPSLEDPILYQNVNGLGTQNILELAQRYNVKKLVLASSSSVYGNSKTVPFNETDVVDFAISPYAATKKANEVMGHVYHSLYDMNIVFLRFFTVYGERQRPDLAIHKFIHLMLENKEITVYGDGTTSRDYTYIEDIVDGIFKSVDYVTNNEKVYEIFNLGSNSPISLTGMIQTISDVLEIEPKINRQPMQPGDVDRTYACIDKARNILGYEPSITFKEGIERFKVWYLKKD
jgi:UDP-glucuronate 4-epimerase